MTVAPVERPHLAWWISILAGLGLCGLIGFHRASFEWWSEHVTTALSQSLIQGLFIGGVLLHVGEASYAARLASRLGLDVPGWTFQTLVLGFPSLRLLLARMEAAR